MQLPESVLSRVLDSVRGKKGKAEIKDDDWAGILENTRLHLKPHFNTFANTPLGHVRLWGSRQSATLESDLEGVTYGLEGCFQLSTLGFWTEPRSSGNKSGTEIQKFWGITRKGDWALVKVRVQLYTRGKNPKGEKYRRHKALELVCAEISDPREIREECEQDFLAVLD